MAIATKIENLDQYSVRKAEKCQLCDRIAASRNFCLTGKSPEACPGPFIADEIRPYIKKHLAALEDSTALKPCIKHRAECNSRDYADCLACVRQLAEVDLSWEQAQKSLKVVR